MATGGCCSSVPATDHHLLHEHAHLDYENNWPEVECSFEVQNLFDFQLAKGQVSMKLVVRLDWLDHRLKERVHYYMDSRRGNWLLNEIVVADKELLFDPTVYIENAIEQQIIYEQSNLVPRIAGMRQPQSQQSQKKKVDSKRSGSDDGEQKVPWLTKSFCCKVVLQLSTQHNAKHFPLDSHTISLSIKSMPRQGFTSLGEPRIVRLAEKPHLWLTDRENIEETQLREKVLQTSAPDTYSQGTPISSSGLRRRRSNLRNFVASNDHGLSSDQPTVLGVGAAICLRSLGMLLISISDLVDLVVKLLLFIYETIFAVLPSILYLVLAIPLSLLVMIWVILRGEGILGVHRRLLIQHSSFSSHVTFLKEKTILVREGKVNALRNNKGREEGKSSVIFQCLGFSDPDSSKEVGQKIIVQYIRSGAGHDDDHHHQGRPRLPWKHELRFSGGNGHCVVAAEVHGGAAWFAGVRQGDKLVSVNGREVGRPKESAALAVSQILEDHVDEVAVVLKFLPLRCWCNMPRAPEHLWHAKRSDGSLKVTTGEMEVLLYRGKSRAPDKYCLEILVVRKWKKYLFDSVVQMLCMWLSLASLCVPLSPDMLPNRMGISLTIILTLVMFTQERPPAIEDLNFSTRLDSFKQRMVFLAVVISLENLGVCALCYAGHPDHTLIMGDHMGFMGGSLVEEDHEYHDGSTLRAFACEANDIMHGMGSRLDALCFLATLAFSLFLIGRIVLKAHSERIKELLHFLRDPHYDSTNIESPHVQVHAFDSLGRSQFRTLTSGLEEDLILVDLLQVIPSWLAPLPLLPNFNVNFWIRWSWESLRIKHKYVRELVKQIVCNEKDSETEEWQHYQANFTLDPRATTHIIDVKHSGAVFYAIQKHGQDDEDTTSSSAGKFTMWGSGIKVKDHVKTGVSFDNQYIEPQDGALKFAEKILRKFPDLMDVQRPWDKASDVEDFEITDTAACGSEDTEDADPDPSGSYATVTFGLSALSSMKPNVYLGMVESFYDATSTRRWLTMVQQALHGCGCPCKLAMVPLKPESMLHYEMLATEWLVQHGDLNINQTIEHCPSEYQSDFALIEIQQAFFRIKQDTGKPGSGSYGKLDLDSFVQEFRDLQVPFAKMEEVFRQAEGFMDDRSLRFEDALLRAFKENDILMRGIVRARLFAGLVSVRDFQCEAAYRQLMSQAGGASDNASQRKRKHDFPIGRKTPLDRRSGRDDVPYWSQGTRVTRAMADEWGNVVKQAVAPKHAAPTRLRGVFFGISGVFFAADDAGCKGQLLPRDVFVTTLERRLTELLDLSCSSDEDLRLRISTLVLVIVLTKNVLHDTAWIACKRNWCLSADNSGSISTTDNPEFVATWALGWWLQHAEMI